MALKCIECGEDSETPKCEYCGIAEACLGELMEFMWFRGNAPEEGKAIVIISLYLREVGAK